MNLRVQKIELNSLIASLKKLIPSHPTLRGGGAAGHGEVAHLHPSSRVTRVGAGQVFCTYCCTGLHHDSSIRKTVPVKRATTRSLLLTSIR
jgi:hypothetical protein